MFPAPLRKVAPALAALMVALSLGSCGGGGGGGGGDSSSPNYSGTLSFSVERDRIDPGDKNRVYAEISDLNPSGAILKFHYPTALRYVANSARLFPDRDEETSITPFIEATDDGQRYLVFFLYPSAALDNSYISLEFDLKAVRSNPDAYIEVDLDNNDSQTLDSNEFRVSDPRFSALERWDVVIEGQSTDPTPTPAASPTP